MSERVIHGTKITCSTFVLPKSGFLNGYSTMKFAIIETMVGK